MPEDNGAFLFKHKSKMENQELQIIEQPELTAIVKKSNIELTKAQSHALAFAPLMQQYHELAAVLSGLDKVNPTAADAKTARDTRLKMVKVRTGADTIKDDRKAILLIESSLIQDLRNVVANTCALTEAEFITVEKHRERVEAERLEKIAESRRLQLSEFGEVNQFVDLKAMDDETFTKFLENERLAFTARKEAAEKAEQERKATEEKAEQERLAKIEADRIEQERIKAENEKLRLENEAKEKELAAERKKQADEKAESERLAKIESEKQAKVLADQKKASDLQAAEAKKIQDDKDAEISKLKAEQEAEKQRKEKELAYEKARIEAEDSEKKAREKAAIAAPDREKVKVFFTEFEKLKFPELQSEQGKLMADKIFDAMSIVRKLIIAESKNLL